MAGQLVLRDATAVKVRAAVESTVGIAGPFAIAGVAAGGGVALAGGGCWQRCCLVSLHSLVLSIFLARFLALGRFCHRVEGAGFAGAVGVASSLQQNSTVIIPCLLTVSSEAQIPLSTHSSNRVRRQEWSRPAVGCILEVVGDWLVSWCCVMPPLGAPPSPPVELPIAGVERGGTRV